MAPCADGLRDAVDEEGIDRVRTGKAEVERSSSEQLHVGGIGEKRRRQAKRTLLDDGVAGVGIGSAQNEGPGAGLGQSAVDDGDGDCEVVHGRTIGDVDGSVAAAQIHAARQAGAAAVANDRGGVG